MELRPRSPATVALGTLTVLGALFVTWVAHVWRWVDCESESYSVCGSEAHTQFELAAVGIVPAFVTFVEGIRRRGHPLAWLAATVLVYAVWIAYIVWAG